MATLSMGNPLLWGVVGAFAGYLLALNMVSRRQTRQLLDSSVIRERAQWRAALREEVAEFCALAYALAEESHAHQAPSAWQSVPFDRAWQRQLAQLDRLRIRIRMRMNPYERYHSDDFQVILLCRKVVLALRLGDSRRVGRYLIKIERHTQRLLKQEWEKIKHESRTGRFRR